MRLLGGVKRYRFAVQRMLFASGAVLLTGVLSVSLLFPFFAAHAEEVEGPWTYEVADDEAVLVDYDFETGSADVVIPATLGGLPVTAIPASLFASSTEITSVNIPGTIVTVGAGAFSGASNLASVTLGQGVEVLGSSAFASTAITSITIPDSVTTMGDAVFSAVPLSSVFIPNSVTSFGNAMFASSSIENIQIGTEDFIGEPTLHVPTLDYMSNVKSVSFGNNVKSIGYSLWSVPLLESIDFGDSVQTIDNVGLSDANLGTITIPDSVTSILSSFQRLTVETVHIPNSAVTISNSFMSIHADTVYAGTQDYVGEPETVFNFSSFGDGGSGNVQIESLILGNNIKTMQGGTFNNAHIENIDFGDSVQYIESAFSNLSGLTDLILPDSLREIGPSAFYNAPDIETITIGTVEYQGPANTIVNASFSNLPSLKEVFIGNSVKEIQSLSFSSNPSLETVVIGTADYTGTPELEIWGAFTSLPALTSLTFGNNLLSTRYSFSSLTALESLQLPDSAEGITEGSFQGLTSLQSVTFGTAHYDGPAKMTVNGFSGATALTELVLNNVVKEISSAFGGATALTELSIPDSVELIQNSSLNSLSSLETLTVGTAEYVGPAKLIINNGALSGLYSLTSLTLNGVVKQISGGAFYGAAITSLALPNALELVGSGLFAGAEQLTSLVVGSPDYTGPALTVFGSGAFAGAPLASLVMHNNVKEIGASAFSGTRLSSVVISDSVEVIGNAAFSGSDLLHTVTIGSGVTALSSDAFNSKETLEAVFIRSAHVTIEQIADAFSPAYGSPANYVKVYTSDPTNPAGLTNYVAREATDTNDNGYLDIRRTFLLNPAQVSVEYRDVNGDELRAALPESIGAVATSYDLTDLENDHLDDFYYAGDVLELTAPAIDGYITPAAKSVSLLPGANKVVFVYQKPTPPADDKKTDSPARGGGSAPLGSTPDDLDADEDESEDKTPDTTNAPTGSNGGTTNDDDAQEQEDASNDNSGIIVGVAVVGGVAVLGTGAVLAGTALRRRG